MLTSSFILENNGTYDFKSGDTILCTIDLVMMKVDDSDNEINDPIVSEDNDREESNIDNNELIDEDIEKGVIEEIDVDSTSPDEEIEEPIIEELPYTASFDYMWYGVGLLFIILALFMQLHLLRNKESLKNHKF